MDYIGLRNAAPRDRGAVASVAFMFAHRPSETASRDRDPGPSCVIVIGGARGSLEPTRRVLKSLPRRLAAAVLVAVHSAPDEPTELDALLEGPYAIPLRVAAHGDRIVAGEVFVAPRACHMQVRAGGVIDITGPKLIRTSRPAVDLLFESASVAFGDRVVGVVLSGEGDDGTDGMRSIEAQGGTCVVQSPSDSLAPGMPAAALLGDRPDYCLLVHQIGPLLVRLVSERSEQSFG